jgi:hypothetical protein
VEKAQKRESQEKRKIKKISMKVEIVRVILNSLKAVISQKRNGKILWLKAKL